MRKEITTLKSFEEKHDMSDEEQKGYEEFADEFQNFHIWEFSSFSSSLVTIIWMNGVELVFIK